MLQGHGQYQEPMQFFSQNKLEMIESISVKWLTKKLEQEESTHLQSLYSKIGCIRFLRKFRWVNKQLKHEPYALPRVQGMILKTKGF